MGYQTISIRPTSAGFGEYECTPDRGEIWADMDDLLQEARLSMGEIYELGIDSLPEGLEDIRGRIHEEPAKAYGVIDPDGSAHYFGIDERA